MKYTWMDSCYILSIFLWQLYGNFVGLSSHVIVVMTIILFIMCEHVCFGTRNRMEILYFIENPIKKIMHSFPRTNKNFFIPYFFSNSHNRKICVKTSTTLSQPWKPFTHCFTTFGWFNLKFFLFDWDSF